MIEWVCDVCGGRHPVDHAGLHGPDGSVCLGCEVAVRDGLVWRLHVERELPSQNRAAHNHSIAASHRYRRERGAWASHIMLVARRAGVPLVSETHKPRRRVRLSRLYGKGQRAIDRGNLWGGSKMVVDMLCPPRTFKRRLFQGGALFTTERPGASLIVDDSDRWCDLVVDQEPASDGVRATRIVLSDIVPRDPRDDLTPTWLEERG